MKLLMENWRKYVNEGSKNLDQWMDASLDSLPNPPISDLDPSAGPDIVGGLKDGDPGDDKVVNFDLQGNVSFDDLKASQNEVGMAQSLRNTMAGVNGMKWDAIDWGDPKWLIEAMGTSGYVFNFKSPIVIANTRDGAVVLDGHHRWSQATMINPSGKINVVGFTAPITADDMLQALHLGIYAVAGQAKTKKAEGGNLFGATAQDIKGYMDGSQRKVNPETLQEDPNGVAPYVAAFMKVNNISDVEKGTVGAIKYAMAAIKTMASRIVPGAPSRDKMPQTDPKVNPKATPVAVANKLATGTVNYSKPIKRGATKKAAE